MGWTPEQTEQCIELAKRGLSAGTILRELNIPGLSRSAVIAKIHREGLSVGGGRLSAQERDHSTRKKSTRPRKTRENDGAIAFRLINHIRKQREGTEAPLVPLPEPPPAFSEFLGIPLENLTPDMCRYPRGDGPFLFCGQPVQPESSYCQYCHAICWTLRDRSRDKVKSR